MNNENKRSSIIITINNENYYNKPFEGWFPLPKKTKTHVTVSITSLMTFTSRTFKHRVPFLSAGGVLKMGGPQVVIIHIIGHNQ